MKQRLLQALCSALVLSALVGCEDEPIEAPIPIPAASVATEPVDVEPEDAGAGGAGGEGADGGGGDAGATAKKGPWDPLRISRCCAALEANRLSAPLTQRGAYDLAVVACNQARKNPSMLQRVRQLAPTVPACQ